MVEASTETQRHGADERLNASCPLVVGGSKASRYVLIIDDLDFKREVFLHVLDEHNEVWKLDGECLLGVSRTANEVGRHVRSHDLDNARLDVWVRNALDETVLHVL